MRNVKAQDGPETGRPEQANTSGEASGYPFGPWDASPTRDLVVPDVCTPSLFTPSPPLSKPIYSSSPGPPHDPYSKTTLPAGHLQTHIPQASQVHISQMDPGIFPQESFSP